MWWAERLLRRAVLHSPHTAALRHVRVVRVV